MDPAEKRFKQFECGWAIFECPSDDEVTDGFCPTYEGAEGSENEWERMREGEDEMVVEQVVPGPAEESGRCSIDEVNLI